MVAIIPRSGSVAEPNRKAWDSESWKPLTDSPPIS
jgi:hypothetical protein